MSTPSSRSAISLSSSLISTCLSFSSGTDNGGAMAPPAPGRFFICPLSGDGGTQQCPRPGAEVQPSCLRARHTFFEHFHPSLVAIVLERISDCPFTAVSTSRTAFGLTKAGTVVVPYSLPHFSTSRRSHSATSSGL